MYVCICGFGHDDFQYKLKLLEGVSSAVGECQGAEDKENVATVREHRTEMESGSQ